jgi:hypothetical protein
VATFTFPTSNELMFIEQQFLPQTRAGNPIFDILPPISKNTPLLTWEQLDDFYGLMQPRGLNGTPLRVNPLGSNQFQMEPGYYGEEMFIDEKEQTLRRAYGSLGSPIDVQDLVVERGNQLLTRQVAREAWLGWQLLVNGSFVVTHPATMAVVHKDSYLQRIYTASVTWATFATATPLQDFRAVQLLSRGYSISLGATAKAYMNRVTFNNLIANSNANDLYGRRTSGLGGQVANTLNQAEMNAVLAGEGLPQIVIYDGGYKDDTRTWVPYIPNGKVLVVGSRLDGQAIGNWVYTKNAVNPGLTPGPSYKVWEPPDVIPPSVKVYRGFNGGHMLPFPSAIIVMNV